MRFVSSLRVIVEILNIDDFNLINQTSLYKCYNMHHCTLGNGGKICIVAEELSLCGLKRTALDIQRQYGGRE